MRKIYSADEKIRKQECKNIRKKRRTEIVILETIRRILVFVCILIFMVPTVYLFIPLFISFIGKGWYEDAWASASIVLLAWIGAMTFGIIPMGIGQYIKRHYFGAWEGTDSQYIMFDDNYMEYGFHDIYFKDSGYLVFKVKYQDIVSRGKL